MNLSVKEVAKILGKSEQFVRISLQQGTLPIGTATKMSNYKYTYHISKHLLETYIGKLK